MRRPIGHRSGIPPTALRAMVKQPAAASLRVTSAPRDRLLGVAVFVLDRTEIGAQFIALLAERGINLAVTTTPIGVRTQP